MDHRINMRQPLPLTPLFPGLNLTYALKLLQAYCVPRPIYYQIQKKLKGVFHSFGFFLQFGTPYFSKSKRLREVFNNEILCFILSAIIYNCSNFRAYVRFRPGKRGVKGKGCLILIR